MQLCNGLPLRARALWEMRLEDSMSANGRAPGLDTKEWSDGKGTARQIFGRGLRQSHECSCPGLRPIQELLQ